MLQEIEQNIELNNFNILLSILKDQSDKKLLIKNLFTILFPKYNIIITPRAFSFNYEGETFTLDERTFDQFQDILRQVFCLNQMGKDSFNPQSKKAKEIADKLLRARQRVAAQKTAEEGESSLAQYVSVITIAISSMSLNDTLNLTIYQLYDLLERYGLYINWDLDIKARLAGAKSDKKPDNWMRPLH